MKHSYTISDKIHCIMDNPKSIFVTSITQGVINNAALRTPYPSQLHGHLAGRSLYTEFTSFYYGFVCEGSAHIKPDGLSTLNLHTGMYFGWSGPFHLEGNAKIVIIEKLGYRGLNCIGGPVEDEGRLLYIDNCRTSLLISPARKGDPCLNLLSFPPHTRQTEHIHPTIRMGVVYKGEGICVIPGSENIELRPGKAFAINAGAPHSFHTTTSPMSIIAYHPESDWGPEDTSHPMLNKTFLKI